MRRRGKKGRTSGVLGTDSEKKNKNSLQCTAEGSICVIACVSASVMDEPVLSLPYQLIH